MSKASVEIVKLSFLILLRLIQDNLFKYYIQDTLTTTSDTTITKTYIELPNILAKININIMIALLVSLLCRAMQVKSIIKFYEILSVNSTNWNLGAVISSIEMCNKNSASASGFINSYYETALATIAGFALVYF